MAYIKVDTDALGDSEKKLSKLQARMDNVQQRLSTLSGQIDWEIKGREELENRINQLKSKIGSISADIGNTAYCLEQVSNEYIAAHNDAKEEVEALQTSPDRSYATSKAMLQDPNIPGYVKECIRDSINASEGLRGTSDGALNSKQTIGINNGYVTYINSKGTLATENLEDLGKKINYGEGWGEVSDLDLVARTLYGECISGDDDSGQEAVAWVLINRMNQWNYKNYRDLVTAKNQFSVIVGSQDSTKHSRNPTNKDAWEKAKVLAAKILTGMANEINNPIENRVFFKSANAFTERYDRYRVIDGQIQIKEGGAYLEDEGGNKIKDSEGNFIYEGGTWKGIEGVMKTPIAGNRFFNNYAIVTKTEG